MASNFSLLFLLMLALATATRLYLAYRQMRCVAAHRAAVPTKFTERIGLEAHQKAADYTLAKTRFGVQGLIVETAVLLGWTLGGGLQLLHDFWRVHLDGLSYGVALIFSVVFISGLIDLPFSLFRQFVIEERFGFNRMSFGLFARDTLLGIAIGIAIGAPALLAVLWMMDSSGPNWWLYVWVFWSAYSLLITFLFPTVIQPLFNKFTPLEDINLKGRIEKLLTRCGFVSNGVFVMDGSKRSSHGNAYFTGFGKNKRIVFFDTLIERLQPEEIEAVLAHELGHFRHRHVLKRIVLMFGMTLGFLWLLGQLMLTPWFYEGLGVTAQNTAMALTLFFLTLSVFTFPFSPLGSLLSRRHEFEADAYAAQHASSDDLIRALVKLYEDNASTLTPDPLHSLFYDSHPPAALRIAHLEQTA